MNQNGLDAISIRELKEVFARAVLGDEHSAALRPADDAARGKLIANGLGDVRHLRKVRDASAVEPGD